MEGEVKIEKKISPFQVGQTGKILSSRFEATGAGNAYRDETMSYD